FLDSSISANWRAASSLDLAADRFSFARASHLRASAFQSVSFSATSASASVFSVLSTDSLMFSFPCGFPAVRLQSDLIKRPCGLNPTGQRRENLLGQGFRAIPAENFLSERNFVLNPLPGRLAGGPKLQVFNAVVITDSVDMVHILVRL